jgi:hypothetical protein
VLLRGVYNQQSVLQAFVRGCPAFLLTFRTYLHEFCDHLGTHKTAPTVYLLDQLPLLSETNSLHDSVSAHLRLTVPGEFEIQDEVLILDVLGGLPVQLLLEYISICQHYTHKHDVPLIHRLPPIPQPFQIQLLT